MNILTAPLLVLLEPMHLGFGPRAAPAPPPAGEFLGLYFKVAILLTLVMVGFGIYLLIAGTPGDLEIAGKGLTIKTKTAGLALTVLGLLFYLAIGKYVAGRTDD